MRSDSFAAEFARNFIIFLFGGFTYCLIEVLYRGRTHPSMLVLGGLCLLWIGGLDSFFKKAPPLPVQMLLGGLFITAAELVTGLILNVWLGLRIWDYSNIPLNFMGQICPPFCGLWVSLSLPAMLLENLLRKRFA